jgi:hypothetical protein
MSSRITKEAWNWPKSIWFIDRLKFGDFLQFQILVVEAKS